MASTTANGIARDTWRQAVCAAAADLRTTYREHGDAIDLGEQLARAGAVHWQQDGSVTVTSQRDPQQHYVIRERRCTCDSSKFRADHLCKYWFAAKIDSAAYKSTKAHLEEVLEHRSSIHAACCFCSVRLANTCKL